MSRPLISTVRLDGCLLSCSVQAAQRLHALRLSQRSTTSFCGDALFAFVTGELDVAASPENPLNLALHPLVELPSLVSLFVADVEGFVLCAAEAGCAGDDSFAADSLALPLVHGALSFCAWSR